MTRHAARQLGSAVALTVALAGCGSASSDTPPASGARITGTVTVFAAASLTESFTRIGNEFEAAHPGVRVRFNFGASSALAQQIARGAPADVFAAASAATMAQVTKAGAAAGDPRVFARNRLEIAVPRGNPGHVHGLADFARPQLTIALCAPQVPCGAAAVKALAAAGVRAEPDTLEQDVKAALSKVQLGEVDAALVYRTDVRAAKGRVDGIDFPESAKAVNDYPVTALKDGRNPHAATAFVDYVLSPTAAKALSAAGFDPPK